MKKHKIKKTRGLIIRSLAIAFLGLTVCTANGNATGILQGSPTLAMTYAGKQDDFASALRSLLELEYETIEAYKAAINRLQKVEYKNKLGEFQNDHERHVREISNLFLKRMEKFPQSGSTTKSWITQGKVVLAKLLGDENILKAMRDNEIDSNSAYQRMNSRTDKWNDSSDIIYKALEDERRHKQWFESELCD